MTQPARWTDRSPSDASPAVVVIGAGPVGLAAGLLLESFGVRALVVDRRPALQTHPKARGLRLRASELLNAWGFDRELRSLSMPDESHRFIYCQSVAGHEIARTEPSADSSHLAAVPFYRVTQDVLEQAMQGRLQHASGVEMLRGVDVVGLHLGDDDVTLELRDGQGAEWRLDTSYVIAADGAAGSTRSALGIARGGETAHAYWHSVLWRGDLSTLTADRPAIVFYTQAGGEALVGIGAAGMHDRWITFVQLPPRTTRPAPITHDEAVAITREALGSDDIAIEIVSTETFRIGADIADRYRSGRAFLVGDSAHVLPPTGGFGINTGFADVHNLVWKLAFALSGNAGDALLDTYSDERRPVAVSNIAWSEANRGRLIQMRAALRDGDSGRLQTLIDDQSEHVSPLTQDLAFSYAGAGGDLSVLTRATVGARAPQAALGEAAGDSVHRLLEGRLSFLVAGHQSLMAAEKALAAAGRWVAAIDVTQLPDPAGHLRERYAAAFGGAVLIRPDGHVAWTTDVAADEPQLAAAVRTTLERGLVSPVSEQV